MVVAIQSVLRATQTELTYCPPFPSCFLYISKPLALISPHFNVGSLFGLFLHLEDGGEMLIRNAVDFNVLYVVISQKKELFIDTGCVGKGERSHVWNIWN